MKTRRDTPGTSRAFFWLAVICTAVMLTLNALPARAQQWAGPMQVQYNPSGKTAPDVESMIRFAAWSWAERLGYPITYTGITNSTLVEGRTIYRWASDLAPNVLGSNNYYYDSYGIIRQAQIRLNDAFTGAYSQCLQRVITHELGHSIFGSFHSASQDGVMYHNLSDCIPSVSQWDVLDMPGPDKEFCYAELTLDNDIFLPDIAGMMANLEYIGDGVTHTWRLGKYIKNPVTQGCTVNKGDSDLNLYLGDVRTMGNQYQAVLKYIGENSWRLEAAY